MEKSHPMNKNVSISALFLAVCIFINSTAYGINLIFNWPDHNTIEWNKEYSLSKTHLSVESNLAQNSESILNEQMKPDGGPDQPEVKGFTPIGTSDMVDPFSGDFSYNIPLMDVDGYPINISYSAGVTMDQEASWVGLGWNLNPGVVNRAMRGIPDDFNGKDEVTKDFSLKRNWTLGGSISADFELFGFGSDIINFDQEVSETEISLSASLGINYNNYSGFSSSVSLGPSVALNGIMGNDSQMSFGLGISGSSSGGASLSPTFGLAKKNQENNAISKLNIGAQFNSRAGLTNASVGYSRTTVKANDWSKSHTNKAGVTNTESAQRSTTLPISSSFNFSQSTYTPNISMPFSNGGGTFSFKYGFDFAGADVPVMEFSGFYTAQWLKYNQRIQPAYGFMNLQGGQTNSNAMLDFNRENDGPFTKNTPALPLANLTYDIFSVSGQGVAGSYRAVRKDIGHVFDPEMTNNSMNGSLGIEAGMGGTFKGGIDISLTYSNSESGDWDEGGNKAHNTFKYGSQGYYFREANEMAVDADPTHFNRIGGANPVRFDVDSHRKIKNTLDDTQGNFYNESSYTKSGTDKRNQVVYTLTNGELKNGLGIEPLHPSAHAWSSSDFDHHLGQFTVLNVEGSRYVYGIAAYSHKQKDVSFAVGASNNGTANEVECEFGLVNYSAGSDNSISNTKGIDNYYNATTTPDFAHSYLLTTILNADYVDADNVKGPSKGDLGGYLKFNYQKVNDYRWRNPVNKDKASFDEGLNTDNSDDKGHYLYGEKELWYVQTIKSKNHIAVFYTSKRLDAVSVIDENGGLVDTANTRAMRRLDRIELFSLPDYEADSTTAVPLKTVHFEYDYSQCNNYSGNVENGGKLTLTKIYFTYQGSNKGRYTPYTFNYGQKFDSLGNVITVINPSYNIKEVDRWNNFKAQSVCDDNEDDVAEVDLRPSDFPYVGMEKQSTDESAIAWNLTTINLPSGGKIQVDYESDDYAYVQHKRANQMFKIIGVQDVNSSSSSAIVSSGTAPISENNVPNAYIYVELMPDPNSPSGYNENINQYVSPGQQIYFRTMMRFASGKHDFVPGYAFVSNDPDDNSDDLTIVTIGSQKALRIKLKGATLMDNGNADYNPITVAAIQYARLNLAKFIPPSSSNNVDEDANLPGLLESLGGAFTSLQEIFIGPNLPLLNDNIGNNLVIGHSWVRLQNPGKNKLGGGHRVKEIRMYDSWNLMTNGQMPSQFYGQTYEYELQDSTSSGVASYEPQIGGDENPWRQPIASNEKNLLAPDTRNYQETPFGEQFFPSARVGYSMVTIKDLERNGVTRTATGKVVHEFYTAKDFPTIVKRTTVDLERFKLPVFAVFFSSMVDEMAASQGFVVENNDMHGKAMRQSVYAQNQDEPITKVEYFYQDEPLILGSSFPGVNTNNAPTKHLTNNVTTINKNGTISQSTIGLTYEAVADFRKSTSNTISGSGSFNTNFTLPFVLVPTISGSGSYERTAFRSATFTKVIERFGIQTKTVAKDLGSEVETNNLAYDAETGTVLLTQTTTDFNDKVYSFTYPAHWYYDQMGQAYRNIGAVSTNLQFVSGGTGQVNSNKFTRGDEVAILMSGSTTYDLGWVTEASTSGIRILLKDGTPLDGNVSKIKVLRSGRRNLQTTPIGTLALRDNPLDNIQGNIFEDVLQAGSVEYSDDWRTFCECFLDEESDNYTTNPYVLGTRGTFRPLASFVHLSGRSQTFENGNSNIRQDGIFTSFNPFYKLNGGIWSIDRQNWTYTSSVVEFSPFGQALETIDALSRYSSSTFGYNQTLPTAVAANTRYRQLGFDGFEDYDYINCSDNHFKIGQNAEIVDEDSHTGRKSIKVNSGSSVVFSTEFIKDCDEKLCDLTASIVSTAPTKGDSIQTTTIYPNLGTAPYQINYEVVNGNPLIELDENGTGLIITETVYLGTPDQNTVKIIITDANGCQVIFEL